VAQQIVSLLPNMVLFSASLLLWSSTPPDWDQLLFWSTWKKSNKELAQKNSNRKKCDVIVSISPELRNTTK
jgi:hypothetical protein